MKRLLWLSIALVASVAEAAGPRHFTLQARFVPPPRTGADGLVSVTFMPTDPDLRVNETPGPRLKLDPAQAVLVDRQPPPARGEAFDPEHPRYLDPALPATFPVALAKGAPKGAQSVAASLTYYYCSKREGWCRKGSEDIAFTVEVP
jgi:hypothetical protein